MARRSDLRGFLGLVALLVVLAVVIVIGVAGYWYLGPYRGFGAESFVEIEHGMSSRAIAQELAQKGIVRSRWAFTFVRLVHPTARLQAGEYRFGSAQTPWQVFTKIQRGEIFYEDFTVPEGSNIFDIANLLGSSDTVAPTEFLKAAADPEDIRDL
ncbi:MAG: endolytic transglycosylase MltG, partial [Acidobacteriota bacterium]|nr:endolytic transglycosylase MltG [Acidobacteriota bacterium]